MKLCVKLLVLSAERPDPKENLREVNKTGISVVEQMLVKGMVVSSNFTSFVGFPKGLAVLPTKPQACFYCHSF